MIKRCGRSLEHFRSCEVKVNTLKGLNDKEEMIFIVFMSNLKIHKMKMEAREEHESSKKTSIVFKASPREHKKKGVAAPTMSEDKEEIDDENFSKLVKMIGKYFINKKGEVTQEKDSKKRKQ